MTEKDILKISQEYKDEKEPLYEKIHERVEETIVQQARKRKRLQTFYKAFPVSVALVLIICLAVILPIVLQPADDGEIRYSDVELDSEKLDITLKEYASLRNEQFLYIDLYDMAEDLITRRYFKISDEGATAYLKESFTDGETGYHILLTIMKNNVTVDRYENLMKDSQLLTIKDVPILYEITRQTAVAQFEYDGYKYYLEFNDGIDEEYLTSIITNMFESQQKAVA